MEIPLFFLNLIAKPDPQRLEGNIYWDDNNPSKSGGSYSGCEGICFEGIGHELSGLFVELHIDDIAEEDLRQGYFETVEGALHAKPMAFAGNEGAKG